MMKAIAITAVVLAIAIAVVLILAATKPDTTFAVQLPPSSTRRRKDIPADQRFSSMGAWSPYELQGSPAMKRTFSGAVRQHRRVAVGRRQNVGSGRMEILDVATPSKIVVRSIFTRRSRPPAPPSSPCCHGTMQQG